MDVSQLEAHLTDGWSAEAVDGCITHIDYAAPDGWVHLAYHEIARGITLMDIDLSCREVPVFNPLEEVPFTINWCAQGRCEVDFGNRGSTVVDSGRVCLSSTLASSFTYPTGSYRGFEYFFELGKLDADTKKLLARFDVDLSELERRTRSSSLALTMEPTGALRNALSLIEGQLTQGETTEGMLLASTCLLLASLDACDFSAIRLSSAYLQRSQRDMARGLHDAIVSSPASPPSVSHMAAAYGISEASLRGYFERVYGESPASFAKALAMRGAAERLAGGDDAVSSIALAAGYSNPSKFSAAFKREFGMNPLEYRRRSRLG